MEELSDSKKLFIGVLAGALLFAAIYTTISSISEDSIIAYSEQAGKAKKLSQLQITPAQLERWDNIAKERLDKTPLSGGGSDRLYAYLYNAQRAFADASLAKSGSYQGSIDPISERILQLFYPNYKNERISTDPYTNALTEQVFEKFQNRFQKEKTHIRPLEVQVSSDTWQGKKPYVGIIYPTFQTWSVANPRELACLAPPEQNDPIWRDQLAYVQQAVAKATPSQKQRIVYWAGMYPKGSGDFKEIANEYMKKNNVPLQKQLEVRSTLATAENDAMIAAFTCKYKYLTKRPDMLDRHLNTYIDTPNHPSYPAGHSVVARTSSRVLNHYFPENRDQWNHMCDECGMSRIWAGLHFPIDHEGGLELGTRVANAAIKNEKNYTLQNN